MTSYRPEIDGLRAVAVVVTILFHAGFPAFSGGYAGVDVFFVISGYLITSILVDDLRADRFSIVRFYERRARRILPALFLVMLCCVPFAWMWMIPSEFETFAQVAGMASVFVANFQLSHEAGYFAAASEQMPLLHLWSLSVEEQYYVLFPWLLVLLRRKPVRVIASWIAGLSVASFLLAEYRSVHAPTDNFLFLESRAWELSAGALLALVPPGRLALPRPAREALAALGLGLIVLSVSMLDRATPFPSRWAIPPVLGAVLVIAFAVPATAAGRLLASRPFVAIGLISYSAYLWHQPLFAFARIRSLEGVGTLDYVVLIGATFALAWLSWRFVEQPVRRGLPVRKRLFAASAALMAAFATFGIVGDKTDGMPQRFDPEVAGLVAWSRDMNPTMDRCHSKIGRVIMPAESCIHGDPGGPVVAIWGDSHAMALTDELGKAMGRAGLGLKEFTFRGCLPLVDYFEVAEPECADFNRRVLEALVADPSISTVILHGRWPKTFSGSFDNEEGGLEGGGVRDEGADSLAHGDALPEAGARRVEDAHRATTSALLAAGKTLVLVYPMPEVGWAVPDVMARQVIFGLPRTEISTSRAVYDRRIRRSAAMLDATGPADRVIAVYPADVLCDPEPEGRCHASENGKPLYFDDDHLDSLGAAKVAALVVKVLMERGVVPAEALVGAVR